MSQPLVNYNALEVERAVELQQDLTQKLESSVKTSKLDSLRQAILNFVVTGSYDTARKELQLYIDSKRSFPNFQQRATKYTKHCTDLITAIESKRSLPNIAAMPLAQQQDLLERILNHFDELKRHLKQIERMEREAKLDDLRSTVWPLRTLSLCIFFIFTVAFIVELNNGLVDAFFIVFQSMVEKLTSLVVGY